MNIETLRAEIDRVDDEIAALLARRMAISVLVALEKVNTGAPVYHPEREAAIMERLYEKTEPHWQPALKMIYDTIFDTSRQFQEGIVGGGEAA